MEKRIKYLSTVNERTLQQAKDISIAFVTFSALLIVAVLFVSTTLNFGNKIQNLKNNVYALNQRILDYQNKIQTVSTELEIYKQALVVMEDE
ncbi:hypothetical protein XO10_09890 [Marinitoga sp. 1135]|uniref:Uncharacterized protein n=1 Tax=Marinitoga piezophila (strain DSM 14283 / JCM 11233 / KA3) TaxID=443254 RepID=H2J712_MARPK|nr:MULTISPECIES: hypothetical protein [Marinitoga]AEX86382.1 hypothetical protein Marpi_2006 [Marinitoga piezophila KA3]APT76775.1 hypothetical protein LN42_10610 [Marinitoga sp. 1137]NUU96545.1 hypothetical protein [Marinitoga sp. 1135]NUU98476.1 hypothetical protein [Marinitoga sp. 1138]